MPRPWHFFVWDSFVSGILSFWFLCRLCLVFYMCVELSAGNSSHHCVQTGSGAHTASCPTGALSLRVKRTGHETNHLTTSSAEVKNVWSYTTTLPISLQRVVLIKKKRSSLENYRTLNRLLEVIWNCNFTYSFVWLWNLVLYPYGVWELGVEDNIYAYEGRINMRLQKML
jgi:hypothetical protein